MVFLLREQTMKNYYLKKDHIKCSTNLMILILEKSSLMFNHTMKKMHDIVI